jgi:hypothetical protein
VDVEPGGVHAACGSQELLSPPLFAPNVPTRAGISLGDGAGQGVYSGDGWVGWAGWTGEGEGAGGDG